MPRRPDLDTICLIGSGPIVIGQACEFDYAGSQALKVLRAEGYRTVVVNSNPATIMTDPGFADRTYLEPLDLEGVAGVLERERPSALLPTLGGQTALNIARRLAEEGVLDELGIELVGASFEAICRAEDRGLFRETMGAVGLRVPESVVVTSPDELPEALSFPLILRPAFTLGGHGGGIATSEDELRRLLDRGLQREPGAPGARRGVADRLGRVRARGHARRPRQRRRRVLDREPRPDGRAHGRLGHRRAADDAVRRGVPGAPRRGGPGHPRRRRRDRRLEHPVRARARDRRAPRHRDEPARVALVGPREQGDRLSDREGRRAARGRVHAGRDPQRPDRDDSGELRADARLRGREVPALRVREVPGRRPGARHADEVGGGGDGDRAHVLGGVPEGDALARARGRRRHPVGHARRPPRRPPPVVPEPSSTARSRACVPRAQCRTSSPRTGWS